MRPAAGPQSRYREADHRTADRAAGAMAKPAAVGVLGERRATALGVAALLAVLSGGAALLARTETQASTGSQAPGAQSRSAPPTLDEPVTGRQASELFLEYLQTVIAKR